MPSNTIRVNLVADSKGFDQGFDKATAKAVGFGSAVGTLAGNIAFSLGQKALSAVTDFVGQSADAFSNLEQAVGGTEAVFGDSSGAIDEYAKDSAKSIGLSEAAFRTATTSIGGQLKRMTGDIDFAAEQSIFLTETAADLAATYGGTTAEAVNALGAAFRGEADPAERFNLDLKIGKVNAKALELGLADTTSEIDDQARAQALLALITEQSADAQGQFTREIDTVAGRTQVLNAEIENQQAALGETAAEWELFWLQQKSNVASGGAIVLNWFSAFSDGVTGAERDIRDFEIRTGEAADTAAAAITIWKEYGLSIFDFIETVQLGVPELEKLRDADEEWLKQLGWTEEGIRKVDEAVQDQIDTLKADAQATASVGDIIAQNLVPAEEDLEEATDDANVQIKTQAELLRDANDELRASIDPIFAFRKGQQELAEATERYNKAVDEFGASSPEAIAAAEDIAEANLDIRDAVADAEAATIDMQAALEAVGIPDSVITAIKGDIDRMREMLHNANLKMKIGVTAPSLFPTSPSGGGVGWQSRTNTYYHSGGIVQGPPGADVPIIAQAGEEIIPRSEVNKRKTQGGIHFHGPVYGLDDFERKLQEVIVRARRRGVAI